MKRAPLLTALISGYFAVTFGVAWFGFRSANEAKGHFAALLGKQAILGASRLRIEKQIAACEGSCFQLRTALAGREAMTAATGDTREIFPHQKWATALEANADVFTLWLSSYRSNLELHFGAFYQRLGLSPAQIDELEDLMTESERKNVELEAVASSQQLADSDPAIVSLQKEREEQLHAAEISLLGNEGYQQIQQLNQAQPFRPIVLDIASYVALTASPFSVSQEGRLMQILADADSQKQNGGSDAPDLQRVDWERVLVQARGLLSGPQLEALRAEVQQAHAFQLLDRFFKRPLASR